MLRYLSGIFVLLFAFAANVHGAAGFTFLGQWVSPAKWVSPSGFSEEAVAVEPAGKDLVVLTTRGIQILDATNPIKPTHRSDLWLDIVDRFTPYALKVVGDYAFITAEINRLWV